MNDKPYSYQTVVDESLLDTSTTQIKASTITEATNVQADVINTIETTSFTTGVTSNEDTVKIEPQPVNVRKEFKTAKTNPVLPKRVQTNRLILLVILVVVIILIIKR